MAQGKKERVDIAERARSIAELAERLNAIDDPMFRLVAEDVEAVQEILRTVLQDNNLVVEQAIPQRELKRWLRKVFICGGKRYEFFFGQVFKRDFPLSL